MPETELSGYLRYTLKHRKHPDQTVRLHGGNHHGEIIKLPQDTRRRGILLTTPPMPSWSWDEPLEPMAAMPAPPVYRRHQLAIYDDVDHAVDYYDYWLAEGEPLPRIGRL